MKKTKLFAVLLLSLSLSLGMGYAEGEEQLGPASGTPETEKGSLPEPGVLPPADGSGEGQTEGSSEDEIEEPVATATPTPEWMAWDRESNSPEEDGSYRYWMDDLKDGTGTLSIGFYFNDEQEAIDGAEVSIKKIAGLTVKNGNAKYTLIDSLKEKHPDLKFDGMVSEDLDALAKQLREEVTEYDKKAVSDKDGKVNFEGLEYGLYLIVETGKSGTASNFADFKAFIVNVPFPVVDPAKYKGSWNYNVDVKPKAEIIKFTPTPTPTIPRVQMGDNGVLGLSIAMLAGLVAGLGGIGIILSTRKDKEDK